MHPHSPPQRTLSLALFATAFVVVPAAVLAAGPAAPSERVVEQAPPPAPPREVRVHEAANGRLKGALQSILNAEALRDAEVSFMATSLDDGTVIAESSADRLINPASNVKLATAAAALDILKPEYRFKTEYYMKGVLKNGVLYGDLVVKGYGDPTVVNERLVRVANELYLFGIERVTGSVVVDASYFDDQDEPKGWDLEEAPDRAYAAGVSGLSFNYNAIAVYVRPGERGQPAIVKLDPPVEAATLEGDVRTGRWRGGLHIVSKHDRLTGNTLLQVGGAVGYRDSPRRIYRRMWDPAHYFGSALVSFLQQRGVKVRHRVVKAKLPEGARLVLVDRSPTLTEIVNDLNHYSNNFIAETLVKAMSKKAPGAEEEDRPGNFKDGLAMVRQFLEQKVGFQPGSYVYENGSGLNDVNRLTARQVIQLLAYMKRDFEIGTEFVTSLAIAGTQGTIGFRMRDTVAERRLRAKTGTLRGVSALSGYVEDPAGDTIAFAILVQGYKGSVSPIWDVQNDIGLALASAGESWTPEAELAAETVEAVMREPEEPAKGGAP